MFAIWKHRNIFRNEPRDNWIFPVEADDLSAISTVEQTRILFVTLINHLSGDLSLNVSAKDVTAILEPIERYKTFTKSREHFEDTLGLQVLGKLDQLMTS